MLAPILNIIEKLHDVLVDDYRIRMGEAMLEVGAVTLTLERKTQSGAITHNGDG